MAPPVIFMFSGQGSQYFHMGAELYNHNPGFQYWMTKTNNILYEKFGVSILDEMYNKSKKKGDVFEDIVFTTPAIFMVEYALARLLIDEGIQPDYVWGVSLGEYTAAAIAGILSFEETIECLFKQAQFIKQTCPRGNMVAVMSNPESYPSSPDLFLNCELAGINYSNHFIISGERDNLHNIQKQLKKQNILFQELPVQYGFHSSSIDRIGGEYKKLLCEISLQEGQIPMISSVLASCLKRVSADYFWDVVRRPMQFQKTIMELEDRYHFTYIDTGPSGTLANFARKNISKNSLSQVFDILTPFNSGVSKIENVKKSIY